MHAHDKIFIIGTAIGLTVIILFTMIAYNLHQKLLDARNIRKTLNEAASSMQNSNDEFFKKVEHNTSPFDSTHMTIPKLPFDSIKHPYAK